MKILTKWIDVSAAIRDEITNKRDFIESETFDSPYNITDFYADMAGIALEEIEPDLYQYINDNEEKRIVEIMEREEIKE